MDGSNKPHQSKLPPEANKFHAGNRVDGKHYWLTPPDVYGPLHAEFDFTFDPCPYPLPVDPTPEIRAAIAAHRFGGAGFPGFAWIRMVEAAIDTDLTVRSMVAAARDAA